MLIVQNLAKENYLSKFKMAVMPIYNKKTFKRLLLQNYCANELDILHKAYGAPYYIKWLKSFRSDHKQILSGWGKVGKK